MSKEQRRRHRPPFVGIIIAVSVAAVALIALVLRSGVPDDEQAAPAEQESE